MATLGEIAKSHGFNSVSEYYNHIQTLIEKEKTNAFKVGDTIILPADYEPTHFKEEKILPTDTPLVVSEISTFTLHNYSVKLEGFGDVWFNSKIFVKQ